MSEERQKNQEQLAFAFAEGSEAPPGEKEGTEAPMTRRETEDPAGNQRVMEEVCERENRREALKRVRANKGSPGLDGMTVDELPEYLEQHWPAIREQLLSGTYEAKPVKRVEIPKPEGGMRKLGIPTVLDRFVQQAVQLVLHDKLMGAIAKRVGDKRLLKLIRALLNAGVMENGLVSPSVEGTPQGGPLSPLLSNLVLDELDRELERRGHRFVRYADDSNIYVRSQRAGQRVMESVKRFITEKLKLKVNESKSAVAKPQERKFLGFSFTGGKELKRKIAPKAIDRFKERVREITQKSKGNSMEQTMEELARYICGWRGYFGFCETPSVLKRLDSWIRRRVRCAFWRQWTTGRKRYAELVRRGVSAEAAAATAGSRHGPWRVSQSRALDRALSNAYLTSFGLPSLVEGR